MARDEEDKLGSGRRVCSVGEKAPKPRVPTEAVGEKGVAAGA